VLVNPHDIEGMKAGFLRAIHMTEREQQRRMRTLRAGVQGNDVHHWAENFLRAASAVAEHQEAEATAGETGSEPHPTGPILLSSRIAGHLRRFATAPGLIVACDFDGTLAPIVDRPEDARILERAQRALATLQQAPGVQVVALTGRSLESLLATGIETDGWVVSGSHGAELVGLDPNGGDSPAAPLKEEEAAEITALQRRLSRIFGGEAGVRFEQKPYGFAVHTRQVQDPERADDILDAVERLGREAGFAGRAGKRVHEFSARHTDKGRALRHIRSRLPAAPVLFIGDDVTDEDVFEILEVDDLGIKVGPGETVADERIPDAETAAGVLATLAELRTGVVIGSE
jgi:trehalose 6-phosphate synthase/phosphatase